VNVQEPRPPTSATTHAERVVLGGQLAAMVNPQVWLEKTWGPQPYGPLLSPACATTNGVHPVGWHAANEQSLWQVATPEQPGMLCEQLVWVPGAHAP
jgi:hypothetical protein